MHTSTNHKKLGRTVCNFANFGHEHDSSGYSTCIAISDCFSTLDFPKFTEVIKDRIQRRGHCGREMSKKIKSKSRESYFILPPVHNVVSTAVHLRIQIIPRSSFAGWPRCPPSSALLLFYSHVIVVPILVLRPAASSTTTRMWDRLHSA